MGVQNKKDKKKKTKLTESDIIGIIFLACIVIFGIGLTIYHFFLEKPVRDFSVGGGVMCQIEGRQVSCAIADGILYMQDNNTVYKYNVSTLQLIGRIDNVLSNMSVTRACSQDDGYIFCDENNTENHTIYQYNASDFFSENSSPIAVYKINNDTQKAYAQDVYISAYISSGDYVYVVGLCEDNNTCIFKMNASNLSQIIGVMKTLDLDIDVTERIR